MAKYNKLWIAGVLGAIFVGMKYYDVLPDGFDAVVVDAAGAAVTALGVYAVPNK